MLGAQSAQAPPDCLLLCLTFLSLGLFLESVHPPYFHCLSFIFSVSICLGALSQLMTEKTAELIIILISLLSPLFLL